MIVDISIYYSPFMDLPLLPLFPQQIQCYKNEQSLLDCRLSQLNCYSNYQYIGIRCQGIKHPLMFILIIIVLLYS